MVGSGGVTKKPASMVTRQDKETYFEEPGRSPFWVTKAGPLSVAVARSGPLCFLRSVAADSLLES